MQFSCASFCTGIVPCHFLPADIFSVPECDMPAGLVLLTRAGALPSWPHRPTWTGWTSALTASTQHPRSQASERQTLPRCRALVAVCLCCMCTRACVQEPFFAPRTHTQRSTRAGFPPQGGTCGVDVARGSMLQGARGHRGHYLKQECMNRTAAEGPAGRLACTGTAAHMLLHVPACVACRVWWQAAVQLLCVWCCCQ
jgi:hypothetical protein